MSCKVFNLFSALMLPHKFPKEKCFSNKTSLCLYTSLAVSRINAVWYTKQVSDMLSRSN